MRSNVIAFAPIRRRRTGGAMPPPSPWLEVYRAFWQAHLDRLESYVTQLMETEMSLPDLNIEIPANEPIVVLTRDFAAPRALVWKVLTEPEHVARWWGVEGHRNIITALDVRPGGKWRIESHAPNGLFIFIGEYSEVVRPERYVRTFGMENLFFGKTIVETHTLAEDGPITHYKAISRFDNLGDRDGMASSGMERGARHGMEMMERILAELQENEE